MQPLYHQREWNPHNTYAEQHAKFYILVTPTHLSSALKGPACMNRSIEREETDLDEDKEGMEMWCNVKHKTCILCKPSDITLISSINKDWRCLLGTTPMSIINKISLLECIIAFRMEVEMIKDLCEVLHLIRTVTWKQRLTGMVM